MSKTYPCPRCGQETEGSYSEGGAKWAICEDCMSKDQEEQQAERDAAKPQEGEK